MHHDLTDQDLSLLRSLPILVAVAASSADREDGQGSTAEVLAGIRVIGEAADAATGNALIAAALDAYKTDGSGEAELLALSQEPPDGLYQSALERCRQAAARFGGRSEDWPGFTHWLRDIAGTVAAASAAGGLPGISSLLGIGGERVTQGESELLADLAAALGVAGD